jgi:hypothetical protein
MILAYIYSKQFDSIESATKYLQEQIPIAKQANPNDIQSAETMRFANIGGIFFKPEYNIIGNYISLVPAETLGLMCKILPINEKGGIGAITKGSSLKMNGNLLHFFQGVAKQSISQHFEDVKTDTAERKRLGYSEIEKYVLLI